jgi:hypothetical protein
MNESACPHEMAVVEAARTEEWTQVLRAHIYECAACADAARVSAWIGDVAIRLGRNRPAPDPTYIWLRAEIERRAQEASGPSWPRLGMVTVLGLAVGLVSLTATLAVWRAVTGVAVIARTALSGILAEVSVLDMTVIGSAWLGLPLLLAATYLLVLRPLR